MPERAYEVDSGRLERGESLAPGERLVATRDAVGGGTRIALEYPACLGVLRGKVTNARRSTMFRAPSIFTVLAALAVSISAAPASAGLLSSPLGMSASATNGTVITPVGKVLTGKAQIIDGRYQISPGIR